jgi:acetyltransferase-like isoleucine patch superfamily enzyme
MLIISPTARVSKLADIEDSVRGTKIIIEDDVVIDSFVRIKPVGGLGDVRIGRGSFINSGTVIFSGNGVDIGEHVLIAPNCTIAAANHDYRERGKKIRDQGFLPGKGGIRIERDVWIGANTVLLDGALLREGCVVGAGSLVAGEVEPYSINVGNPIRCIGHRIG